MSCVLRRKKIELLQCRWPCYKSFTTTASLISKLNLYSNLKYSVMGILPPPVRLCYSWSVFLNSITLMDFTEIFSGKPLGLQKIKALDCRALIFFHLFNLWSLFHLFLIYSKPLGPRGNDTYVDQKNHCGHVDGGCLGFPMPPGVLEHLTLYFRVTG